MSVNTSVSSFDSSNSFYSTDSSTVITNAQTTTVPTIVDHEKLNKKYSKEISVKIHQFLVEVGDDSLFQSLVSTDSVQVDTSVNPGTPFCFRTCAEFESFQVQDGFALFLDLAGRGLWDSMCHSIRVIQQIDPLTFIYHLKLKATWPTTARDSLTLVAFRKLSDGRYVSVAWSIQNDLQCPPDHTGNYIRMNTRISANLFTPTDKGFRLTQLIDGDPKGNIPSYLIKKVSAKSFPATIESIKQVLASRPPVEPTFYESIISTTYKSDTHPESADTESTENADEVTNENYHVTLDLIFLRLIELENTIKNQSNHPVNNNFNFNRNWLLWTPLAISSINLLLLLNLNLRKK